MSETGQSYVITGTAATSHIIPDQFSNLYFTNTRYKEFESLDAIVPISKNITYKDKTAFFRIPLTFVASTFQAKDYPVSLPVTNPESLSEEDSEEREWNTVLSKPRARSRLRRRAAEIRRQIAAGETEEGGFAIE